MIVLKPEDGGTPGTSHGMCADCQKALDDQMTSEGFHEPLPAKVNDAYEDYRRNFPNSDPRD